MPSDLVFRSIALLQSDFSKVNSGLLNKSSGVAVRVHSGKQASLCILRDKGSNVQSAASSPERRVRRSCSCGLRRLAGLGLSPGGRTGSWPGQAAVLLGSRSGPSALQGRGSSQDLGQGAAVSLVRGSALCFSSVSSCGRLTRSHAGKGL